MSELEKQDLVLTAYLCFCCAWGCFHAGILTPLRYQSPTLDGMFWMGLSLTAMGALFWAAAESRASDWLLARKIRAEMRVA